MNEREKILEYNLTNKKCSTIQERYCTIIEQTNLFIYDINLKNHDIYVSENFLEQYGISCNKRAILKSILDLNEIHPEDVTNFKSYLTRVQIGTVNETITFRRKNREGGYTWIRSSRKNLFDSNGSLIRVIGTAQDVSSEMWAYEEIRLRAESDPLTEIPNLRKFAIDAEDIIKNNTDKQYAMVVFDIDKFRIINDLYGAREGDRVLNYIGSILKSHIKKPNLYCRMYVDQFAILMEYKNECEFYNLSKLVSREISQYPIPFEVKLSFGVCKVDNPGIAITTLCDHASLAKKTIKGNILKLLSFYDETIRQRSIEDQDIENEMSMALVNEEFQMFLQPKVAIASTEVVGAEALVRWVHPKKGIIYPDRFIPLFEKNGFITKLDYYIWEKAFATLRKWIDIGFDPVPISVNVSRLHIHNTNLVDIFLRLSKKYKVPTNLIELELTETVLFDNIKELTHVVQDLKQEGFVLSIDDFGSGYSSLHMLKDVPVDVLKIDRAFLNETVDTERGKTVIRYTIDMAKQLNMDIVAEGVENFIQAEFLYNAGCEIAQGYYYSKPIPTKKFEQYAFGLYNGDNSDDFNLLKL